MSHTQADGMSWEAVEELINIGVKFSKLSPSMTPQDSSIRGSLKGIM